MRTATLCLLLAIGTWEACGPPPSAPPAKTSPAKVEKLPGEADLVRITLTADAARRLGIETRPVERRSVPRERTLGGDLQLPPGALITVTAPLAGTLSAPSPAAPGSRVDQGATLFVLRPFLTPESRVGFASALSTAEGDVQRGAARLAAAEVAHARQQKLFASDAGSARAVDEARAELEQATAALAAARRSRDAIHDALTNLDSGADVTVAAPIAGLLAAVHAAPGQTVAAGAPLFDVLDAGRLWVRVPVYSGDLRALAPDAPAAVRPLGDPTRGDAREATPVAAPPSADPAAAAVHVWFALDNEDGRFRPGERVAVTLRFGDDAPTPTVPRSAIVLDAQGGAWVYERVAATAFERRRVDVRGGDGDVAVIARGPAVGAEVVVAGAAELFGTEFGGGK